MNDNRTTELETLSKLKMAGRLSYWRGTIDIPESVLHAICDDIQAEHDQDIAATLGETCEVVSSIYHSDIELSCGHRFVWMGIKFGNYEEEGAR